MLMLFSKIQAAQQTFKSSPSIMTRHSPIPSYLVAPPSEPVPAPPIDTREQTLPLTKLTWVNFERLIVRLIRRDHEIIDSHLFGTSGQAQDGIDILAITADPSAPPICIQCKKIETLRPATIRAATDHFLRGSWKSKVNRFTLCVANRVRTTKQQEEVSAQRIRLHALGIDFQLWDGSPGSLLSELLKSSPDLVDDFFGREWVKRFNGPDAAESLGDRLPGPEYQRLRSRLYTLYSTIFIQHDPGIRIDSKEYVDYQSRYVPADVLEETNTTNTREELKDANTPESEVWSEYRRFLITDELPTPPQDQRSRLQLKTSVRYESRRPVLTWINPSYNCVILGPTGYGKSVLLRYIALSILQPDVTEENPIHPAYHSKLPMWVSFARLTSAIKESSHVSIEQFFESWLGQYSFPDVYPLFTRAIKHRQVLLLVDGLDESLSDALGREALDRLIAFCSSHNAKMICTTRPNAHNKIVLPQSWMTATLARFDDNQITSLAKRWFSIVEAGAPSADETKSVFAEQVRSRAQNFLHAARDNPRTLELARTPLLCQVLIELFRFSHQLPEARTTAYRQIVELLLSKHPAARAQAGGVVELSSLADLNSDNFKDILVRLASTLQRSENADHLTSSQCESICEDYLVDDNYGLGLRRPEARQKARKVVDQLHRRFSVLVERAPDEYNFVHLSIQEYLAAEHLSQSTPEEQIDRIADKWIDPSWRESLICWFGILGSRRQIRLMTDAVQRIEALGNDGAWQRMQSLELRAAIATSDLRLPVVESRKIIMSASEAVETSPFVEHRTSLARSLAIGALDSPVQEQCRARLRGWLPGQDWQKRLGLIRAFRHFPPSTQLLRTLQRGISDEDGECRRASSEVLAFLFSDSEEAFEFLRHVAKTHARPDVRASALHGLAANSKWIDAAVEVAQLNRSTRSPELLIEILRVTIQASHHTMDDFRQLFRCWSSDMLDFRYREEIPNMVCDGWPNSPTVRRFLIEFLEKASLGQKSYLPIQYLVRCHRDDPQTADILTRFFRNDKSSIISWHGQTWEYIRESFRGDRAISEALRTTLEDLKKEKGELFLPSEAIILSIIGTDESRDDLIELYNRELTPVGYRHWIASELISAWSEDDVVQEQLQAWTGATAELAAPLSSWSAQIIPDAECREEWLRKMAGQSVEAQYIGATLVLLDDFPDHRARDLCLELIDSRSLWYYHRIQLKSAFTRAFPNDFKSVDFIRESLEDIEGPRPGDWAIAFRSNAEVTRELLRAAVCCPVDVRLAVASVFRSRATDYSTVVGLTPGMLAGESGPVRGTCLAARARAARGNSIHSRDVADVLSSELAAIGMHMHLRNRAALCGFFELRHFDRAASILVQKGASGLRTVWSDWVDQDPVSIGSMIHNWSELESHLAEGGLDSDIPINSLLLSGYGDLLEQIPTGRNALDEYCRGEVPEMVTREYIEARAKRQLSKPEFRDFLIGLLRDGSTVSARCTAARLLTRQFSEIPNIRVDVPEFVVSLVHGTSAFLSGIRGYLCLAWPELLSQFDVKSVLSDGRSRLSARDRLLVSVAYGDGDAAKSAARDMLSGLAHPRSFDVEDIHAMFVWFQSDVSRSVLEEWLVSDSPIECLAGLSFFGRSITDDVWRDYDLEARFNSHMTSDQQVPMDGLDPRSGVPTSWTTCGYSVLRSRQFV